MASISYCKKHLVMRLDNRGTKSCWQHTFNLVGLLQEAHDQNVDTVEEKCPICEDEMNIVGYA